MAVNGYSAGRKPVNDRNAWNGSWIRGIPWENGLKFGGFATGIEYSESYGAGDTICCDVNSISNTVTYYKNSRCLGRLYIPHVLMVLIIDLSHKPRSPQREGTPISCNRFRGLRCSSGDTVPFVTPTIKCILVSATRYLDFMLLFQSRAS